MEGLAAFFGVSRPTLRSALAKSQKLRDALARGKAGRTGQFLRRQQQLADGYWYCAVQVDEKGRVICRFPLEAREDECPEHPGVPDPRKPDPNVKRAFCSPHVIASIWVGKNQHGQEDRSSILSREARKIEDDELAELAREALEFQGEELPEDGHVEGKQRKEGARVHRELEDAEQRDLEDRDREDEGADEEAYDQEDG